MDDAQLYRACESLVVIMAQAATRPEEWSAELVRAATGAVAEIRSCSFGDNVKEMEARRASMFGE